VRARDVCSGVGDEHVAVGDRLLCLCVDECRVCDAAQHDGHQDICIAHVRLSSYNVFILLALSADDALSSCFGFQEFLASGRLEEVQEL